MPETPRWVKFMSSMYWATSNYGQSAITPIIWLAVTAFIFWFIYAFTAGTVSQPSPGEAAGFMVEQIIRPFSVLVSSYKTEYEWVRTALVEVPFWLKLTAFLQSAMHLSLIALFLLAVRWRFRRG